MKMSVLVRCCCAFLLVFTLSVPGYAQGRQNDIPASKLPKEVVQVLGTYARVLLSETLEQCAEKFVEIAGGSLIQEDGKSLHRDVMPFSLKKDHSNLKFYSVPLVITRVNKGFSNGDGYGATAISGVVYKIWIGKKKGVAGMPAPISILVPEGHPTIKTPKVIGIGSL